MLHFDPPWLAAVLERSPHLFVGQWPVPDWARLLWGLCVAWLAARYIEAPVRRLVVAAAAIGLAGIASSWIAVDLLESAFVAGLQLWRAHWLVHFFAIVLVPVAVAGLWRSGYGRNGQHIARLLDAEGVRYVALDLDSERVREAALAGDTVVFADSARREALIAAGILRAAAVVITFAESAQAVRAHTHIQSLNPSMPVIVRARDDADVARLTAAGASEIVPEALESGLMLASHTLVWVGVPLNRVVRRVRAVRDEQYGLLQGLFHGASDEADTVEAAQQRLHAVTLTGSAHAIGKSVAEIGLEEFGVRVKAVRRPVTGRRFAPSDIGVLEQGDVVVLLGVPDLLAAAEIRLLQG